MSEHRFPKVDMSEHRFSLMARQKKYPDGVSIPLGTYKSLARARKEAEIPHRHYVWTSIIEHRGYAPYPFNYVTTHQVSEQA